MKKIHEKFSVKQSGISMIIGLAVSFIVLGITLSILFLSEKYREQSQNINLSNQTFFTLEAGQEAALFHHNARNQGIHFSGTVDSVPASQKVEITPTNTVNWIIRGRTDDLPNDDVLTGTLNQNQVVQIPFSWDSASNVSQAPSVDNITDNNFELKFGRFAFDSDGNPTSTEVIGSSFDFGATNDDVMINWALSKIDSSENLTTFVPRSTLGGLIYCDSSIGTTTGFFCESNLGDEIRPDIAIPGYVLPGKTETTLDVFYADDDSNQAKFMMSFQPLLPFTHSNGTDKVEGIPWSFEIINGNGFPKNYYEMEIQANIGDFQKVLTKDILEKTSLQGLDTAIID